MTEQSNGVPHHSKFSPDEPNAALVAQLEACASAYYGQGQLGRARTYLEQLVKLRPEEAKYWALLGVVFRRQKRRAPALKCLKRAAEIDPHDFNTLINLGETLVEVGQVPAGVKLLRAVFDEGFDPAKAPEQQDEFTIRSGAILEFVQKSLRAYVREERAKPAES